MLPRFKTVSRRGSAEIIIKKSRFIGHAAPAASEDEALQFIEGIRKDHWDATHNCFAYVIGERDEYQKASDDGEPSGTAGRPILEVLKHQGLKNTVVVVTRYFGGIMLGAGGLVRAYTDGAVAAVQSGEPVYRVLHRKVEVTIDYTWHGKVEKELRERGTRLQDTSFTDKVTLHCLPLEEEAESFISWVTDVTQGTAAIRKGERGYFSHSG